MAFYIFWPWQAKKDVTTVDDPFDSPTYHIPEKPVTFTEGASYSLVILAGLGVAGAAGYAVFKELLFQPKEWDSEPLVLLLFTSWSDILSSNHLCKSRSLLQVQDFWQSLEENSGWQSSEREANCFQLPLTLTMRQKVDLITIQMILRYGFAIILS